MAEGKVNGNGKAKEAPQARRGAGWKVRESFRNVFSHVAEAGATVEDVKHPDYFALVAKDLRPRDTIEVWAYDGSWVAEFVVLDAGLGWAQVHLRSGPDRLPAVTRADPDTLAGFEFERDGRSGDWYAIRKIDRQELGRQHGLKSKKDVIRFVEDHASTQRR